MKRKLFTNRSTKINCDYLSSDTIPRGSASGSFIKEAHWLISRFPNSEYADVAGLCKVVDKTEIATNDYSLTAGRYVGVAPQIDEDFDYEERMAEIKVELHGLNEEAVGLAEQIQLNLNEMGL